MGQYYIYILSSYTRTIYTGITNDLARRIAQHKQQVGSSFAGKYKVTRLVYFEAMSRVQDAIAREKPDQRLAARKEGQADRVAESRLG